MGSIAYILPWILVLLTIATVCAAKFLPFKSIAGISVISVLALFILGTAIYQNLITASAEDRLDEAHADLAAMEEWKYLHLDELALIIAQQLPPEDEDLATLERLRSYGWTRANPDFRRVTEAALALEKLRGETPAPEHAIYLYKGIPETVNKDIVRLSLKRLGYKVIPPQEDEEPLERANVLYFGKYVKTEDVKMTALTLMRAGVELTAIKPFPKDTRGNLRAVKLEHNEFLGKRKPMGVQEVVEAKDFK
ncbi:MAG: hypothetical protein R3208_13515 [Ketobacteraceae bacterium]|nr:hypothetical protein [Ketobacteraceae bacterium]